MSEPARYEGDIFLLKYILGVIKDSRTKNRVQARIEGLLRTRLEESSDCVVYTREEINEYADKNKGN